ncbi:MAG: potassium transporter TrkG [Pseudomonadota bacterium]
MSSVFRLAAFVFTFLGGLIGLCALVGGSNGLETTNIILSGIVIYISLCLYFVFHKKEWSLNHVEGCFLLLLLWVFMPLPVAISFTQSMEISLLDAYFEAVSGLTTTGASTLLTLEETPLSVLLMRGLLQWVGGLLTLVSVTVIIAPAGLGGLQGNYTSLLTRNNFISLSQAYAAFLAITGGYLVVSIACFVLLTATRVPVFEAFQLTLSTVSSGGFRSSDTPIQELGTPLSPFILSFFMLVAGTSIIWQRHLVTRRWDLLSKHRESYFYFGLAAGLSLVYAATFFSRAGSVDVLSPFNAITEGIFTAASLVSTTGLEIRNGSFSVLPATMVLIVTIVGGCSFSTAGGISLYRLGGMLTHSFKDLTILVYPNSVQPTRFGSQSYDLSLIKAIWSYFFTAMVVLMLGTIFLSLRLPSFEAALTASVAAFSNIGGFYSTGWSETGQWLSFAQMDAESKSILTVLMILGRLHILVLLTAFNRTYWLRSR